MPCERLPIPGGTAIICGRGQRKGPSEEDQVLQDIRRQLQRQQAMKTTPLDQARAPHLAATLLGDPP